MPAIFPRWTNKIPLALGVLGPLAGVGLVLFVWVYFSPKFTDVGYRPEQPVPFSHKLHAGEMGLDCRYCHNTVERAAHAAIPPAATCMNCHSQVKTDSPKLAPVRRSYNTGESVPWVRIHQLPDFAYFDHSPHVAAGVGCASCHGRIDTMTVVAMDQPLSMGWCLDCHRNPEPHLRPLDQVTNMSWGQSGDDSAIGSLRTLLGTSAPTETDAQEQNYNYREDPERTRLPEPPVHCSGCHR